MYGGFLTGPDDDGADLGVLFWHKDGFSTACGHGTIALGVWSVETGLVASPSGRVTARVAFDGGLIRSVSFVNVPSRPRRRRRRRRCALDVGGVFVHDSIVGSRSRARALSRTTVDGRDAVIPELTGIAHRVDCSHLTVDPRDSLVPGLVLR